MVLADAASGAPSPTSPASSAGAGAPARSGGRRASPRGSGRAAPAAGGRLFPGGIPPAWRGVDLEAHGLLAGPASTVSFALRWHGVNAAVLWEVTGDPVALTAAVTPSVAHGRTGGRGPVGLSELTLRSTRSTTVAAYPGEPFAVHEVAVEERAEDDVDDEVTSASGELAALDAREQDQPDRALADRA